MGASIVTVPGAASAACSAPSALGSAAGAAGGGGPRPARRGLAPRPWAGAAGRRARADPRSPPRAPPGRGPSRDRRPASASTAVPPRGGARASFPPAAPPAPPAPAARFLPAIGLAGRRDAAQVLGAPGVHLHDVPLVEEERHLDDRAAHPQRG